MFRGAAGVGGLALGSMPQRFTWTSVPFSALYWALHSSIDRALADVPNKQIEAAVTKRINRQRGPSHASSGLCISCVTMTKLRSSTASIDIPTTRAQVGLAFKGGHQGGQVEGPEKGPEAGMAIVRSAHTCSAREGQCRGSFNFRFRRSICQSRLMLDQRLIAFARHSLQRAAVQYFNDASRVGDNALTLYLTGHLCHRCPSHSQHIGKEFLRQRNGIARCAIG